MKLNIIGKREAAKTPPQRPDMVLRGLKIGASLGPLIVLPAYMATISTDQMIEKKVKSNQPV